MFKKKYLNLKELEEVSLNAWPALGSIMFDGWLLRFSSGYTKRANSVNIIGSSKKDPLAKIKICEEHYQNQNLVPLFRLTDFNQPETLKDALLQMRYIEFEPTSVMVLNMDKFKFIPGRSSSDFKSQVLDIWMDRYYSIGKFDQSRRSIHHSILKSIMPRKIFAELDHKGTVVSTGMAVLENYFAGLFDLFTFIDIRRQGFGTELLNGLLQWAKVNGAKWAYLQVVDNNDIAVAMYRKFGFKKVYSYSYYAQKSSLNRIPSPR